MSFQDRFEQQVWTPPPQQSLDSLERPFAEDLAAAGFSLDDLFRGGPAEVDSCPLSDESLARAVRMNFFAKQAFEELLVNRYAGMLLYCFIRWGNSRTVSAEDLRQELYRRSWQSRLVSFDPAKGTFRTFIRNVAYHLWVDKVGRSKKVRSIETVTEPIYVGPGPEQSALLGEQDGLIKAAFQELPEHYQQILKLAEAGQSAGAIASILNTTPSSVYMLRFRAIQRMRDYLWKHGYETREES